MGLVKIIEPAAWDFGEPVSQLIKISGHNRKLQGYDRSLFIKRAGEMITHTLDQIKFASGEVPIHLIALGAHELYSHNRNGDGFDRDTCRKQHGTFTKYARFYRNHINKDRAISYGVVKASMYNDAMARVELICGLNSDEPTAKKNGGLVADREMEKLASGKEIPVSMAVAVPYDVCSFCGHQSRTRDEYCDSVLNGGLCKAGGLKHNIGKTVEVDGDLHHLGAFNPNGRFFDISHVWRPADRIAYVTGMLKAASVDGRLPTGAELADALGVQLPLELLIPDGELTSTKTATQVRALQQLAALDRNFQPHAVEKLAFLATRGEFTRPPGDAVQTKFGQVLRAMADQGICLDLADFIHLTTDNTIKQASLIADVLSPALPGLFVKLADDPQIGKWLDENPYTPANAACESLQTWARAQASCSSLSEPYFTKRAQLGAIREIAVPSQPQLCKTASADEYRLLQHYALYKLAFLAAVPISTTADSALTAKRALAQNYAC